jgi:predicted RNase H-like HicB family nuclease
MTIEVEQETDGRWLAEVVELPGVMRYGPTRDEAVARVKILALRVLADRLEQGESIPALDDVFAVRVRAGGQPPTSSPPARRPAAERGESRTWRGEQRVDRSRASCGRRCGHLAFGRLSAVPFRRQASEQYFTSSQQRSHFFRQVKGRWQTGQSLLGRGARRGGIGWLTRGRGAAGGIVGTTVPVAAGRARSGVV